MTLSPTRPRPEVAPAPPASLPEAANTTPTASSTRRRPAWLVPMARRFHFYAGLLIGPFILLAAITGTIYAVAPQIDQWRNSHLLQVPEVTHAVSVNQQVSAAQRAAGSDAVVASVQPAVDAISTTVVAFAVEGSPKLVEGYYVHPGTGEVLGHLTLTARGGTMPFTQWLSTFHKDLHLGQWGVWYSEIAATWLGLIVLAGLVLWARTWQKKRAARVSSQRRWKAWHGWVGALSALGLIVLSITGVTWSEYAGATLRDVRQQLGWVSPRLPTALPGGTTAQAPATGGEHANHEHGGGGTASAKATTSRMTAGWALGVAAQHGVTHPPIRVTPPTRPGQAWVVAEQGRQVPLHRDRVAIDPRNGTVLATQRLGEASVVAQAITWGILFHRGELFGLANILFLIAVGLGAIALVVSGYVMWWKRRPRSGSPWRMGKEYPRTPLKDVPWPAALGLAAMFIALGAIMPLLAYPLLAFLALDLALTWRRRKKAVVSS